MFSERPRLESFDYLGIYRYLLTFCTSLRHAAFTAADIVDPTLAQISQCAREFSFSLIAYVFMPDHVHLLVEGTREDADLRAFVHRAKQKTGYEHAQRFRRRLWQPSFYDRVLRDEDPTLAVVRYIFENPVRAGLVADYRDYSFLGSELFTREEIFRTLVDQPRWQP
jgi:REP-associated tyrosine transposase